MPTNKKISELPSAAQVFGIDLGVLVQDNATLNFQFQLLVALLQASITVGAAIGFGTVLPQNDQGIIGDVFFKTDASTIYQKNSLGAWSAQWHIPVDGDGTTLYGTGIPDPSLGKGGDSYIDTSTGIFYKKEVNTWNQKYSMATGPQGPQGTAGTDGIDGTDGKTVLNGITNPSNLADGTDGDFYLNTASFVMFGPKGKTTPGVWDEGTELIPNVLPGAATFEVPFTAVTGKVIIWQTDIPPGQTQTYAALLGNKTPEPEVTIPTDNPNEFQSINFNLNYTKIGSNLSTLTLDWAIEQTGIITF